MQRLEGILHGVEDGAGKLLVGSVAAHVAGADLAAKGSQYRRAARRDVTEGIRSLTLGQ